MNELIAKLAEQAAQESALLKNQMNLDVKVNDVKSYQVPANFIEKFAELIVRECDRYARSVWEHGPLLGRDLLIHFGVEEMSDE